MHFYKKALLFFQGLNLNILILCVNHEYFILVFTWLPHPGQSKAKLSNLEWYYYRKITTTTCVYHKFRAIQYYVNYAIQRRTRSLAKYIWMLPLHSCWNSIPFLYKTKLWESNIDHFWSIIRFLEKTNNCLNPTLQHLALTYLLN